MLVVWTGTENWDNINISQQSYLAVPHSRCDVPYLRHNENKARRHQMRAEVFCIDLIVNIQL